MKIAVVFKEKKKETREKMSVIKRELKGLQTENTNLE
jgi:hypothetical protein